MNNDPYAVDINSAEPEYFLNNSILGAQQDPNIAERTLSCIGKLLQDNI